MKFWYAKLGVQHRYHYFNRLTMFVRKTGAPKLRGRAVEVLGLNHVMVKIWEETLNPQVEIHRMILQMLKMNNKMEDLLHIHRNDTALPAASATEFVDAAFKMAHLNNLIHEHFKQEPDIPDIFAITIKLHMVLHVALHSHEVSPRLTWNFTGEDEMGILKFLARTAAKVFSLRMSLPRCSFTGGMQCTWRWKRFEKRIVHLCSPVLGSRIAFATVGHLFVAQCVPLGLLLAAAFLV